MTLRCVMLRCMTKEDRRERIRSIACDMLSRQAWVVGEAVTAQGSAKAIRLATVIVDSVEGERVEDLPVPAKAQKIVTVTVAEPVSVTPEGPSLPLSAP